MPNDTQAIIFCSRGHAEKMSMTILAMASLADQPELLRFGVRIDHDDHASAEALARLNSNGITGVIQIGDKPPSTGTCINDLAAEIPDAKVYHILNDDVVPLTPGWDTAASELVSRDPTFVGCWQLNPGPTAPDYPVIGHGWYKAAGRIFTDDYAYWFDDMELSNRAVLVRNKLIPQIPASLCAKKTKTARMRDFDFWWTLFRAQEPARIEDAQRIANNLHTAGLMAPVNIAEDRKELIKQLHDGDLHWYAGHRKNKTYETLADNAPPDEAYMTAKARATNLIINSKAFQKSAA